MQSEGIHGGAPSVDPDMADTLLDMCNEEVKAGKLAPENVQQRMHELMHKANRGTSDVGAVALGTTHSPDAPQPPSGVQPPAVQVDLLEKQ